MSTLADPGETWKDLAIFGYDKSLKLTREITEQELEEEIPTETEDNGDGEEEDGEDEEAAWASDDEDNVTNDEEDTKTESKMAEAEGAGGTIDRSEFDEDTIRRALAAAQF